MIMLAYWVILVISVIQAIACICIFIKVTVLGRRTEPFIMLTPIFQFIISLASTFLSIGPLKVWYNDKVIDHDSWLNYHIYINIAVGLNNLCFPMC